MDWMWCIKGEREMTPKFLARTHGQLEFFPLLGKTEEGPGLGRKLRSLVSDMLKSEISIS